MSEMQFQLDSFRCRDERSMHSRRRFWRGQNSKVPSAGVGNTAHTFSAHRITRSHFLSERKEAPAHCSHTQELTAEEAEQDSAESAGYQREWHTRMQTRFPSRMRNILKGCQLCIFLTFQSYPSHLKLSTGHDNHLQGHKCQCTGQKLHDSFFLCMCAHCTVGSSGQHILHTHSYVVLPDHPPEVNDSVGQRALCRNIGLWAVHSLSREPTAGQGGYRGRVSLPHMTQFEK